MTFTFDHTNINVTDIDRSVTFYEQALGLRAVQRHEAADGSFVLVFMSGDVCNCLLELTWLRDHPERYDLGENEWHLCFGVDDIESARTLHESMGCVCYVNEDMGLYFIEDPDGYWTEIVQR